MRLVSPLGTPANIWPIVPAPDVRWRVWSSRWNEDWQGKPKYSEKTCPSATLSTTNPKWPDLGSNSGRRGGKPATNRLSYGTAQLTVFTLNYYTLLFPNAQNYCIMKKLCPQIIYPKLLNCLRNLVLGIYTKSFHSRLIFISTVSILN
jgi:hypothetical protein